MKTKNHASAVFNLCALAAFFILASLRPAQAQDQADDENADPVRKSIVSAVRDSADTAELDTALKKSVQNGATPVQVVEAKMVWILNNAETADITNTVAYLQQLWPVVQQSMTNWDATQTLLIKKTAGLEGISNYVAAVKANGEGDSAAARQFILRAVWLDPGRDEYTAFIKKIQVNEKEIDPDAVQRALISAIKDSSSTEELETALAAAEKSGATKPQTMEAKLIWVLRNSDGDNAITNQAYLKGIWPEVEKSAANWPGATALMLKKPSQLMAVTNYLAALKADADGDSATAQSEIMRAVWLDPTRDYYTDFVKKMSSFGDVIPMDLRLDTTDGKKVALADYVKGHKALYIQVWATWCGPCLHLFPVLSARAKSLPPQGIAVVALNSELGRGKIGGNLSKARELKMSKNMNLPWLIEPDGGPYTQALAIDSVPRALVVSPEGKVLFNDHPMDKRLATVLKKFGVTNFKLNAGLEDETD